MTAQKTEAGRTVRLRNGSEEVAALVAVTFNSIKHLMETKPIVAYELAMIARDSAHDPFGQSGADLRKLGLLEKSGRMHDSVRNIVLSAFVGDGMDMGLRSPLPRTEE